MLRSNQQSLLWGGVVIAIGLPILLLAAQLTLHPGCDRLEIDDCVTGTLFQFTIKRVYPAKFTFVWDADFFACMVFVSYLLGAVIVAITAGTAPSNALSASKTEEQFNRVKILNTVLFSTTAVLLVSMVTAKLRFDVGLATLGAPVIDKNPNLAFLAYQTTVSAIMAYWATVLSLSLALIYLPSFYLLSRSTDIKLVGPISSLFAPDGANFSTFLKAAAIISPPIINKLIELLGAAPTGT
jgi:DMSO reductase anchor subunit